jgi:hypothetical protein
MSYALHLDDLFLVDALNIDKLWKYMQRGR